MSALNGRCRPLRLFRAGILGVHVTMARALLVLHDPFRVGAWVIPRGRGCVFLPGACAPGCPARPFQGRLHTANGPQPGMPAKYMTIDMDRGRLLTVRPLRLIRRSPGTTTRRIAKVSRVGNNQRAAGRIRDTIGIGIGIGIDIDAAALPTSTKRHPILQCFRLRLRLRCRCRSSFRGRERHIAALTKRRNGRAFQGLTATSRGFRLE